MRALSIAATSSRLVGLGRSQFSTWSSPKLAKSRGFAVTSTRSFTLATAAI
jgi:hypothetical protein